MPYNKGTNKEHNSKGWVKDMARRLFFQTKLYDYTSQAEAEKHIKEMETKGWHAKRQDNGNFVFMNSQDEFSYSVEFFKEMQ